MLSERLLDQKTFNKLEQETSNTPIRKIFHDSSTSYIISSHLSLKDLASFARVSKSCNKAVANVYVSKNMTIPHKDKLMEEWKEEYREKLIPFCSNSFARFIISEMEGMVSGEEASIVQEQRKSEISGAIFFSILGVSIATQIFGVPMGLLVGGGYATWMSKLIYDIVKMEDTFSQRLSVFKRIKEIPTISNKDEEKKGVPVSRQKNSEWQPDNYEREIQLRKRK